MSGLSDSLNQLEQGSPISHSKQISKLDTSVICFQTTTSAKRCVTGAKQFSLTSAPHPMTYKNMADNAPYVTTCKDHGEYLRTARRITPWIAVEGFQFETISFDVMHLIFLGVARNHVPSVLKLLKTFGYHYSPAESDEKFLQRVSLEMKQDCKDHGFPVQILSPSFLCVWNLCALVLFLARSPT